ncbi:G-protein coupled receptor 157-like [Ostrea edulis]|uniref:G-protein coupled receptor 157-like n=1 Tax=Ostrea edulis TaxID=37623 RepID=UPI0024AED416|nr:G-protein coupled receptor 157-like [Ostrea edulis]
MELLWRAAILNLVSSGLSVVGGILIFIEYNINFQHNRLATMFVFMTIVDVMYAAGYIVGNMRYYDLYVETNAYVIGTDCKCNTVSDDASSGLLCKGQSFVTTYASLVSFAWTCNLLIILYLYYRGHDRPSRLREWTMHIVGWILPGVVVIIAVSVGALGEDRDDYGVPWCWVRKVPSKGEKILWMLLAGKFWEILTYIITFVIFVLCMKHTSCNRIKADKEHVDDQSLRIRRFPYACIILLSVRCFGTVRFFLYVFDAQVSDTSHEWLLNLQSIGDGSLAFVNFVFYLFTNPSVL